MSLEKYHQKRHFSDTPEPRGKLVRSDGPLRFVVQEHHASHLHYDFRLEMGGTLKSWAIPKGPSLDPDDKRLAVEVEDHPLNYRTFEGVIPEGNYGAGTVKIWDEGTYQALGSRTRKQSEKALLDGLRQGHLTFFMKGKRLQGEFSLIRMRGRGKNTWLLMKKRESDARVPRARARTAKPKLDLASLPAARINVAKITPMLATLVDEPFDREGWIFEMKWDGYRALAEVDGRKVRLFSRNHKSFNEKYAELIPALGRLERRVVLDGEIVVLDREGKSSFQLLQNYGRTGEGNLVYCVFDILAADGRDLRSLPLLQRKEILRDVVAGIPQVLYSDHVETRGRELFESLHGTGLEGMMAKDGRSSYRDGERSGEWLKVKTHLRQEAIIAGFTAPRGSRKLFGSLVLAVYEAGQLAYIGHTGTGFDRKTLKEVHARLVPLRQKTCPFRECPKTNTRVTWVKPELVCEVDFQEWTDDGIMRQPSFVGLRIDKPARQVSRERARHTASVVKGSKTKGDGMATEKRSTKGKGSKSGGKKKRAAKSKATAGGEREKRPAGRPQLRLIKNEFWTPRPGRGASRGRLVGASGGFKAPLVTISHPEKIYFPEEGITKGDLISYYREIAPRMLPYLQDRPQNLHRHPNGIEGEGFFQKDVESVPEWVQRVKIHSESGNKEICQIVCQDEPTLLYLVNLGCIEINPWSSRLAHLDYPDFLVVDLDPEGVAFDKVVEVAKEVRHVLEAAEIESYPKTSGATGLHIFIPLGARYEYEQARQFAEIVARLVERRCPKQTSTVRNPEKRKRRVYLDYLQNGRGQTLAAPYSVRPRPGAPVSTPLKWEEVRRGLDPRRFTIHTIFGRLQKLGDLFQPVLGSGIDLEESLERLSKRIE